MSDSITQMRLSMRLDGYLSEYTKKNAIEEISSREEWDRVWHIADVARIENELTPQLVDNVRVVLKNFEIT